jgi:N-acetyl-anhydromuramyl-L-alanine amidase AmpD
MELNIIQQPIPKFSSRNNTIIDLIVIHTCECSEVSKAARNVANFFAMPEVQASAHYIVDNREIVQCVADETAAWHAPGVNARAIGIEHAGYARQKMSDWVDDYSSAELELSARLVATLCIKHKIPIQKVVGQELVYKGTGICGHVDVNNAGMFAKGNNLIHSPFYNAHSDHYDPGPYFPWDNYLKMVTQYAIDKANGLW